MLVVRHVQLAVANLSFLLREDQHMPVFASSQEHPLPVEPVGGADKTGV